MLPLGILTAAQGSPMLVELKTGESYSGTLITCDTWMNLTLKVVVETAEDGENFMSYPEVYIKGNTIKYIRIGEEIIEKVKEQQAREQANRGGRGGMGGRGDHGGRGDRGRGMRGGRGRGRGRGGA
ncbi:Sm-like ribonucleoprotein [Delitschia confertaspora ATCC 74209]|uniref:LSM complex subunit LSM4 n=1 Tax=Delitschia confertaspora ATCC 74209 TaxID=1513339 RepID=A0A9P4MTU7_9PLEO|nr:Sm-like ribonucleoprotein [Delitschia confertaspora ATCC 74209]